MDHFLARARVIVLCLLAATLALPSPARAYAVLSHEAIIDAAWEMHIKPLLLKKFPQVTEEDLSRAQAFAYGGAIIQDMGYYPYGSPFAADNYGHRLGINRAVPILYPGLRKKFGDSVAFEDNRLAHVKTEFGFDVLEIARERYAPESYHDFVGFEVSRSVLDQAFRETYGLELKEVLVSEEKVLNSYRRDVSKLIPKATRIAWHLKKDEIKDDIPDATKRKFLFNLSRANYEREWGKDYRKPSPGERFLAFLYKLIPKFGPLKILQFRTPTPQTEQMFEASFNATLDHYRELLTALREGKLDLPNDNFDVGENTGPGKYRLNDEAHAELLDKLAENKFAGATSEVRAELLHFFAEPDAPYATKHNVKAWTKVQTQLQQLKSATVISVPANSAQQSVPEGPTSP